MLGNLGTRLLSNLEKREREHAVRGEERTRGKGRRGNTQEGEKGDHAGRGEEGTRSKELVCFVFVVCFCALRFCFGFRFFFFVFVFFFFCFFFFQFDICSFIYLSSRFFFLELIADGLVQFHRRRV